MTESDQRLLRLVVRVTRPELSLGPRQLPRVNGHGQALPVTTAAAIRRPSPERPTTIVPWGEFLAQRLAVLEVLATRPTIHLGQLAGRMELLQLVYDP